MKILVIGGGGREHALVWKLRQSSQVEHIWCAPGNPGIASQAECLDLKLDDIAALVEAAARLKPDLTVVGPELPLVAGIGDEFRAKGLLIVGPSRQAAQLEGSKVFAKEFMGRNQIPTASVYGIFDSPGDAYAALCEVDWPVVIKADGLCAGKGVLVTSSPDEATSFIERLMEKGEFGDAGKRVIIEEGLVGSELSYIVLTGGRDFLPFAPTRDYKRAFDGDRGPNTGGMGAISCSELLDKATEEIIQEKVVRPTIAGMAKEGHTYQGFLYFGLMITSEGAKVLEFNCRPGDPETEALVMRMNFDLAVALQASVSGDLRYFQANWSPAASACVVLASEGYPGNPFIGKKINGIKTSEESRTALFHARIRSEGIEYYTCGGRVLVSAAAADSLPMARENAYRAAATISFEGMHYRRDIGLRDHSTHETAHG